MRAAVVREFGPVESAAWAEMPDPVPGPNEVLLRIAATAANYVDLLVISGKYQFLPERPFVPGKLPAGTVVAAGSEVKNLKVGDRVLSLAENGGYAELVAVPAAQCFRLPDAMSFVEAAAMALVYDTAWFALRDRARVLPGETVLVLGATGGVGLAALQLAKAFGARVLAGVSSPEKSELVRASGADEVIDLSRPNLRGRLVVIGFAAGRIPTIKANYLLLKNIEVSGLQVSDYRKRRPGQMAECLAEVFAL